MFPFSLFKQNLYDQMRMSISISRFRTPDICMLGRIPISSARTTPQQDKICISWKLRSKTTMVQREVVPRQIVKRRKWRDSILRFRCVGEQMGFNKCTVTVVLCLSSWIVHTYVYSILHNTTAIVMYILTRDCPTIKYHFYRLHKIQLEQVQSIYSKISGIRSV